MINSFGKKNPNKFFYVIKVDKNGGGGLFSNVLFVLNHLEISKRHNFIPVIDMKNFPTRYNENKKINHPIYHCNDRGGLCSVKLCFAKIILMAILMTVLIYVGENTNLFDFRGPI